MLESNTKCSIVLPYGNRSRRIEKNLFTLKSLYTMFDTLFNNHLSLGYIFLRRNFDTYDWRTLLKIKRCVVKSRGIGIESQSTGLRLTLLN